MNIHPLHGRWSCPLQLNQSQRNLAVPPPPHRADGNVKHERKYSFILNDEELIYRKFVSCCLGERRISLEGFNRVVVSRFIRSKYFHAALWLLGWCWGVAMWLLGFY